MTIIVFKYFAFELKRVYQNSVSLGRYISIRAVKIPLSRDMTIQWTVLQLSIMIIYNSTWPILIQQIRIILSGDNLTQKTQKKDPFTSLHKIKANLQHWTEFEVLRNGAYIATTQYIAIHVQYRLINIINSSVQLFSPFKYDQRNEPNNV